MTTPIQGMRHRARQNFREATDVLSGRAGLSKEEQIESLTTALNAAKAAVSVLESAVAHATERDFDAYKAEKTPASFHDDDDHDEF